MANSDGLTAILSGRVPPQQQVEPIVDLLLGVLSGQDTEANEKYRTAMVSVLVDMLTWAPIDVAARAANALYVDIQNSTAGTPANTAALARFVQRCTVARKHEEVALMGIRIYFRNYSLKRYIPPAMVEAGLRALASLVAKEGACAMSSTFLDMMANLAVSKADVATMCDIWIAAAANISGPSATIATLRNLDQCMGTLVGFNNPVSRARNNTVFVLRTLREKGGVGAAVRLLNVCNDGNSREVVHTLEATWQMLVESDNKTVADAMASGKLEKLHYADVASRGGHQAATMRPAHARFCALQQAGTVLRAEKAEAEVAQVKAAHGALLSKLQDLVNAVTAPNNTSPDAFAAPNNKSPGDAGPVVPCAPGAGGAAQATAR